MYLLRADVRLRQGNPEGAAEDIAAIQKSAQAQALANYVEATQAGRVTCKNVFLFEP